MAYESNVPTDFVRLLAGTFAVALFAFLLRYIGMSHEPTWDELYHVLAARSWAENGTFAIADGEYTRAALFTRLIGIVTGWSDGSLDAIRLFCITIGTVLVLSVFLSVYTLVGRAEAYVVAFMLALMPGAIYLSQFIRFYSLHALLFWLASFSVYVLMTRPSKLSTRAMVGGLAVALFVVAAELQKTTLIGLVAVAAGTVALCIPRLIASFRLLDSRGRTRVVVGVILLAAAGILMLAGPFGNLVDSYRSASLWSTETNAGYYVIRYRSIFGTLWTLFPLAVLYAVAVNWRPALFAATVFIVAFLLHSFAGMRSERYLFYVTPYFLLVWGIVLVAAYGQLGRVLEGWLRRWLSAIGRAGSAPVISHVALALGVAWLVVMTPGTEYTVRLLLDRPGSVPRYWFNFTTSWGKAADSIRPLVEEADIFLTSQGHHAIYYIGDFDVEISATGLSDFQESGGGTDIDPRTGRRTIADVAPLRQIVYCNASGVVVVDERNWRNTIGVNDGVADFIELHLEYVAVPEEAQMRVYRWAADDTVLAEQRLEWLAEGLTCSSKRP
jgi:hypothetical protein